MLGGGQIKFNQFLYYNFPLTLRTRNFTGLPFFYCRGQVTACNIALAIWRADGWAIGCISFVG